MDIITAIAAGTKALEALKAIREIDKSFDAAVWKSKVAELMGDVADMKIALIEATETIQRLEAENRRLVEKLHFKVEKTITQRGWVYEVLEDGEPAHFPFCQNCMANGKFIRLVRSPMHHSSCNCPGCKNHYDTRSVIYEKAAAKP